MNTIKKIILEVEEMKTKNLYKEAEKILEKAIIIYSNDYRLYEEIADINLYTWEFKKAEKAINYALELNPESATWNYLKGFLLLSNDKIKESIEYLEKSNKNLWNNSEVLRNLGWAYTMTWDNEKWIAILKRALIIAPWDKLISEDLAMALIWVWELEKWNMILKKVWKSKNKI